MERPMSAAVPMDDAARRRALDPRTSFVVQAPAGSGKTELLTRRILTLLATVNEPEQVVALTFTRKAAAEMRQRVVELLRHAHEALPPVNAYHAQGLALAERVLEQDARYGWQLLDDPQRLQLGTIDSLATRLAHRLPLVSTLGAPTGIVEDARALHLEAAGRFIDENLKRLDRVLLQNANRYDRLQQQLADLLATRDQWMRFVMPFSGEEQALRDALEFMLSRLVTDRLQALSAAAPPGLATRLPPIIERATHYLIALADAEGKVPGDKEAALLVRLSADGGPAERWPGADLDDLEHWQTLSAFLMTADAAVRKRVDKSIGFPAKTAAKLLGEPAAALAAHKQSLESVLESIADDSGFTAALAAVRTLPPPTYTDEEWALLEQLVGTLPQLVAELYALFGERGELDFTEISQRALLALGTDEQPTDLALSMDLDLQHVLVDEFQDTSRAQWSLFERLVAGWEPGDGRTFFIVGDPMQSIYGFREGDVALFLQARDHGIGPVDFEPLTLQVNFRSEPAIINWVNAVFTDLFPDVADANIGAVTYEPSRAQRDGEGGVQVLPMPGAIAQEEAAEVVQRVERALAMDAGHTVGILVRSRSAATPIVAALNAAGIRFRAVEMDLLGERPVVRDLVALTLALHSVHDRLHWLAVLRGPLCGLLLADLHALIGDDSGMTVLEGLRDAERLQRVSADGRRRLTRFTELIEPAVERAPRSALVPWVESVWLRLGGPAACHRDGDLDAAERCLARLVSFEQQGRLWQRGEVLGALNKLYAAEANDELSARVQIMTVHKSKGLEFDTVILPALARRSAIDTPGLINWYESTLHGEPNLLFAPIDPPDTAKADKSGIIALVRGLRDQREAAERLRLLYVACTRAKAYLHLTTPLPLDEEGQPKKALAGSFLQPLHELVCASLEPADASGDELDGSGAWMDDDLTMPAPEAPPLVRPVTDWCLPTFEPFDWPADSVVTDDDEQEDKGPSYDWSGGVARHVGTVVHANLLAIGQRPVAERHAPRPDDVARIDRELAQLGVTEALRPEAAGLVERAIRNTLETARGRWILSDDHAEIRPEWALSAPDRDERGRLVRIRRVIMDRTFVDREGVRWIVDYKTGSHEGSGLETFLDTEQERYRDQLDGYARLMQAIDARPIRVGLWFPLVAGWREWVPSEAVRDRPTR